MVLAGGMGDLWACCGTRTACRICVGSGTENFRNLFLGLCSSGKLPNGVVSSYHVAPCVVSRWSARMGPGANNPISDWRVLKW